MGHGIPVALVGGGHHFRNLPHQPAVPDTQTTIPIEEMRKQVELMGLKRPIVNKYAGKRS